MRLDVFAQVVTAHEAFVTLGTGEPLLSSVSTQVSLELIRPRESFSTEEPVADKWAFPGVPPEVRLEM